MKPAARFNSANAFSASCLKSGMKSSNAARRSSTGRWGTGIWRGEILFPYIPVHHLPVAIDVFVHEPAEFVVNRKHFMHHVVSDATSLVVRQLLKFGVHCYGHGAESFLDRKMRDRNMNKASFAVASINRCPLCNHPDRTAPQQD